MKNPTDITIVDPGFRYEIPVYGVEDTGIVDIIDSQIQFCRGDKSDPGKPRNTGFFVESLLAVAIHRLQTVNQGELATHETAVAITKLEEALMWLEKRSRDRKARGVEQTYRR